MHSVKCPQCSLVNFASAEVCKRCGVVLANNETEGDSAANDANITATQKPRSSFRDVAIMLCLIAGGFLVLMVGGAFFLLRLDSQPPRKFSSKAEQIQALMDSYSQADCERNDAAVKSVYHTMNAEEKAAIFLHPQGNEGSDPCYV